MLIIELIDENNKLSTKELREELEKQEAEMEKQTLIYNENKSKVVVCLLRWLYDEQHS